MTRDAAPSTKKARQVAGTYLWNKFVATLRYRKGKGHILLEVRKRGGSGAAWERTEGETGDLGKRGNGQKDWTPKSWRVSGEAESGDRCLVLGG